MAEKKSCLSKSQLGVPPSSPGGFRSRSTSIVWIDMLTKEHTPSDEDNESITIRVHDDWEDPDRKSAIMVDDEIFNYFANDSEYLLAGKFLAMLENAGLRRTDPRLGTLFSNLRKALKEEEVAHRRRLNEIYVGSIETLHLAREHFKEIIMTDIIIISAAFRQQLIVPKFDQFCKNIEDIFEECRDVSGQMRTTGTDRPYLEGLRALDPNYWGLSICTIDGQRFSIGDAHVPVTFHSLCKPVMYALSMKEMGIDLVHKYVGQEPSGTEYNALALDGKGLPHNPMINSGSIMIHALLQAFAKPKMDMSKRFEWTQKFFKKLVGEEYIGFNNGMFLEKREVSDRNWALAHYMKEYQCFPPGIELAECLEYYLQTSSFESTCDILSVMAATLANGGVCPTTGERCLDSDIVADVLSVMFSCGMFDFSGKFGFRVGLPAKSSISGIIMLVIPNILGMIMWSPGLDEFNNSSRGVAFCEKLVKVFNFHEFENLKFTEGKIDPHRKYIETKGSAIVNLLFSASEGDLENVIRLHLSGVDMGLGDYDGRTALHVAASGGHYDVVEYLLRRCNANHLKVDRWNETCYDNAVAFKHDRVAELLRSWGETRKLPTSESSSYLSP